TKEAFSWWDDAGDTRGARDTTAGANDLQDVVVVRHPEIAAGCEALSTAGAAHAARSGSGSAGFGLFGRAAPAPRAAAGRAPGGRVFLTRTVDRRGYRALGSPARVQPAL